MIINIRNSVASTVSDANKMSIILDEIATLKTIASDTSAHESYYLYHGENCTYLAVHDWNDDNDNHISLLYKIPGIADFEIAARAIGDFDSTFACKCQIHDDIIFGKRAEGEHIGYINYRNFWN